MPHVLQTQIVELELIVAVAASVPAQLAMSRLQTTSTVLRIPMVPRAQAKAFAGLEVTATVPVELASVILATRGLALAETFHSPAPALRMELQQILAFNRHALSRG